METGKKSRKSKFEFKYEVVKGGYLRVRWTDENGKRQNHNLGGKDTPENRQKAAELCQSMTWEARRGVLDLSDPKWKINAPIRAIAPKKPKKSFTVEEIYQEYILATGSRKAERTQKDFRTFTNRLKECPIKEPNRAIDIRDWLLKNKTHDVSRRTLMQINAAMNWALDKGLIDENPFDKKSLKLKKERGDSSEDGGNPFTREEIAIVIDGFRKHPTAKHYAPLVEFLFLTGCRPSEAIALQKKHIKQECIRFEQKLTEVKGKGIVIEKGLKTQEKRDFPMTNDLIEFFKRYSINELNNEEFIFKSSKGLRIRWSVFHRNAWNPVMKTLKINEHTPYDCRDTFITLNVKARPDLRKEISQWVGNSPATVDKHYLGSDKSEKPVGMNLPSKGDDALQGQ